MSDLPDPTSNRGAWLHECRRRMRRALVNYAELEGRITAREEYHDRTWGRGIGATQAAQDLELRVLIGARDSARQRARTYAAVIAAELALDHYLGEETR